MIRIHNLETGQIVDRELSNDEIAMNDKINAAAEKAAQQIKDLAAAKAALLEKLGITEEEARLLLGGN